MKRILKNILIGVALLGLSQFTNAQSFVEVPGIKWGNTNMHEKIYTTRITKTQLQGSGDIYLYSGQTAILQDVYLRYVPAGEVYDVSGTTDSLKVYGAYNGSAVSLGYFSDSSFVSTSNFVSYTPMVTGKLSGTSYYINIPTSKFTGDGGYFDIYCRMIIFK